MSTVLSVKDLSVTYRATTFDVNAVRNVSFEVNRGEILALVGESGSGKTTIALALMRLLPTNITIKGKIRFSGKDGNTIQNVLELSEEDLRRTGYRWGKISIVFQGAMNSLNPLLKVKDHFIDTGKAHGISKTRTIELAEQLLEAVRLQPSRVLNSYPHQLSGGMKQRVMIALALLLSPDVIILDEPTTALDTLTQRQILELIKDLRKRLDIGIIMITHDLSVVADVADKVLVIYRGYPMEFGDTYSIYRKPYSPYTLILINSFPSIGKRVTRLKASQILSNSPVLKSRGCPLVGRCPYTSTECFEADMILKEIRGGHFSSCVKAETEMMNRGESNE